MLKQTLDAVSRLDYPNFECVCIINNTPDPEFWRPIQDHCRALGERFKFINAEKVQGFKAGALRIATPACQVGFNKAFMRVLVERLAQANRQLAQR